MNKRTPPFDVIAFYNDAHNDGYGDSSFCLNGYHMHVTKDRFTRFPAMRVELCDGSCVKVHPLVEVIKNLCDTRGVAYNLEFVDRVDVRKVDRYAHCSGTRHYFVGFSAFASEQRGLAIHLTSRECDCKQSQ